MRGGEGYASATGAEVPSDAIRGLEGRGGVVVGGGGGVITRAALPSISGVVVNYHTPDSSLAAARSLLREGAAECVIVNNGGVPPIPESAEPIRILDPGGNVGFGRGVNFGVGAIRGDLVVLLNSDAELLPGALTTAQQVLGAVGGIVGSKELSPEGVAVCWAAPVLTWGGDMLGAVVGYRRVARWAAGLGRLGKALWWGPSVSGGFMVMHSSTFAELEGFRPDFFMYGDDVDMCWRAWSRGIPVTLLEEPLYRHANRGSPTLRDRQWMIAESDALLAGIRYGRAGAGILLATRVVASWTGCALAFPFRWWAPMNGIHAGRQSWCRHSSLTLQCHRRSRRYRVGGGSP